MRIVRLANFWTPTSGGLRTALAAVGRGYRAAGHEPVLVVPGAEAADEVGPAGRTVVLPGRRLPGTPYRVLTDLRGVREVLERLGPDRLELSDRSTLWPLAGWAESAGVPLVLWAHERVDAILASRVPGVVPLRCLAGRWNRATLARVPRAVAPSRFVAEELRAAGIAEVRVVPHGVDLDTFDPGRRPPGRRDGALLVWAGRLSREKRPELALAALGELRRRGLDCRLVVVGDGPERRRLEAVAGALPVSFAGHVADREAMAHLLALADVALATCPVESFGLAALEALACGTPVVAVDGGALPEVVDPRAGRLADGRAPAFADAVEEVLAVPEAVRRRLARRRAEERPWSTTVAGLLAAHAAGTPHRVEVPA